VPSGRVRVRRPDRQFRAQWSFSGPTCDKTVSVPDLKQALPGSCFRFRMNRCPINEAGRLRTGSTWSSPVVQAPERRPAHPLGLHRDVQGVQPAPGVNEEHPTGRSECPHDTTGKRVRAFGRHGFARASPGTCRGQSPSGPARRAPWSTRRPVEGHLLEQRLLRQGIVAAGTNVGTGSSCPRSPGRCPLI
jgi:hypothetical protein